MIAFVRDCTFEKFGDIWDILLHEKSIKVPLKAARILTVHIFSALVLALLPRLQHENLDLHLLFFHFKFGL